MTLDLKTAQAHPIIQTLRPFLNAWGWDHANEVLALLIHPWTFERFNEELAKIVATHPATLPPSGPTSTPKGDS